MKAHPGTPSNEFDVQISPVVSKKYFNGAAIDPNLVGDPKARPEQLIRSSFEQNISPFSGIRGSLDLLLGDTLGTVLIFTFKFNSSAPSASA